MATRDATKIDRGPGRLFISPTVVSGNPPYGGTEIGAVRGVEIEFMRPPQSWVFAEEYGHRPVEGVEAADGWLALYVLLRSWDDAAITTLFANSSTGASGSKVVSGAAPGTIRDGALLSNRAVKLLFVPNDAAHRAVLLYRALPVIVEGSRTAWQIAKETVVSASFVALPDATLREYQIGKLGDLTL